jgi:arylsulfatase A-like enzyme
MRWVSWLLLSAFCFDAGCGAAPDNPKWNVVLITLDTTRADALGAYGQTLATTPNLDRLAAEGVLFEQAVTSAPHTLGAHATIFTGLYPYAHGVRSNQGYLLPETSRTLAEVLSDYGYRTGAEIAADVLMRGTRIAQGFEHVRDSFSPGVEKEGGLRATRSARVGDDITRHGLDFIRSHRNEAFFLWLH